jgi:hypothetical protein
MSSETSNPSKEKLEGLLYFGHSFHFVMDNKRKKDGLFESFDKFMEEVLVAFII